MQYTEGYLAFIDILGFSEWVKVEGNMESVEKVIKDINRVCDYINEIKKLGVKAAFFSDSIVLMEEDGYWGIIIGIRLLEYMLNKETGLLYRGAIVKGKYFHDGNMCFGPAVIEAHNLETKSAIHSRIIVSEEVGCEVSMEFFRDIDNKWCFNPYFDAMWRNPEDFISEKKYETEGAKRPIIDQMCDALMNARNTICENIVNAILEEKETEEDKRKIEDTSKENQDKERKNDVKVIDKYMWRTTPFNYTCDYLIRYYDECEYLNKNNFVMTDEYAKRIAKLKIDISEFTMINSDVIS